MFQFNKICHNVLIEGVDRIGKTTLANHIVKELYPRKCYIFHNLMDTETQKIFKPAESPEYLEHLRKVLYTLYEYVIKHNIEVVIHDRGALSTYVYMLFRSFRSKSMGKLFEDFILEEYMPSCIYNIAVHLYLPHRYVSVDKYYDRFNTSEKSFFKKYSIQAKEEAKIFIPILQSSLDAYYDKYVLYDKKQKYPAYITKDNIDMIARNIIKYIPKGIVYK